MRHRDTRTGRFISEREVLDRLFDEVDTWLSTAPTGYEFHRGDGTVSRPRDAFNALATLRTYVLGD